MKLPTAAAVMALLAAGAVPAAAAAHGGTGSIQTVPVAAPAISVPAGCKSIPPSKTTTDSDGATYYYFQIPHQANGTEKSGTQSSDMLVQVLPPKGFDPSTASDAQLDKYQYPKFSHATPAARQKYFAKPHSRDIGVVQCPPKPGTTPAAQPAQASAIPAKFDCTERDNTTEAGYTGCSDNGFDAASVSFKAPALLGCPTPPDEICGNSNWVGLGGIHTVGVDEPFYQAGTSTLPPTDTTTNQFLFTQYFDHGNQTPGQLFDLLAGVSPGDVVTSEVNYIPNATTDLFGTHLGEFSFCAEDTTSTSLFHTYCSQVYLADSDYDLVLPANPLQATAEAETEAASQLSVLPRQLEKWNPADTNQDITFSQFQAVTPSGASYSFPAFPTVTDPNPPNGTHPGVYPVQMCGAPIPRNQTTCSTASAQDLATVPASPASQSTFQVKWQAYGPAD